MKTTDLYSSLAERGSATERVIWRGLQRVSGYLEHPGSTPLKGKV